MSERILHVDGLVKEFDGVAVLNNITAEIQRGETIGLLGLNGAGKTTLIETILGFAVPARGTIALFEQSGTALASEDVKHRIGFVPQQDELLENMRGRDYLSLIAQFYPRWNNELIERLAREWLVPLDKLTSKLSVGQRQKLSILAALGHEPELIFLDEPVASLDPVARRAFLKELVDIVSDGDRTILFSTHIVTDLERVANRVWILKDGRLVLDEPLDRLKERTTELLRVAGSDLQATQGLSLEEIFLELHR